MYIVKMEDAIFSLTTFWKTICMKFLLKSK